MLFCLLGWLSAYLAGRLLWRSMEALRANAARLAWEWFDHADEYPSRHAFAERRGLSNLAFACRIDLIGDL